jgi:phosphohistidine phosphatase
MLIGFDKARIVNDIRVYEAELDTLIRIISEVGETFETVCLCGHNPGLSELITYITGERNIDIPTCGLCMIELDILSWKNDLNKKGKIAYYKIPEDNENPEL